MTKHSNSATDHPQSRRLGRDPQALLQAESLGIFVREVLVVLTLVALLIGSAYASKAPEKKIGYAKSSSSSGLVSSGSESAGAPAGQKARPPSRPSSL